MSSRVRHLGFIAIAVTVAVAAAACSSSGSKAGDSTDTTKPNVTPNTENIASLTPMDDSVPEGAERLHFKIGPFVIEPGQNNIANRSAQSQQPQEDGWVVGIPRGYHPVCAAPGYRLYYLWALSAAPGAPRALAVHEDPAQSWMNDLR